MYCGAARQPRGGALLQTGLIRRLRGLQLLEKCLRRLDQPAFQWQRDDPIRIRHDRAIPFARSQFPGPEQAMWTCSVCDLRIRAIYATAAGDKRESRKCCTRGRHVSDSPEALSFPRPIQNLVLD